jgi:hypothetical protein
MPERSRPARDQRPPTQGFWKTTWGNKRQIVNWDISVSVALAIGAHFAFRGRSLSSTLPSLLVAEFGVVSALLGLVIAGLAIVVAFMSSDYAAIMMRTEDGPAGEFWPFWYVSALSAVSIIVTGASLLLINEHPRLTRLAFGLTTLLTSYVLLAAVNLVGFIKSQGETRAWQLSRRATGEPGPRQDAPGPGAQSFGSGTGGDD